MCQIFVKVVKKMYVCKTYNNPKHKLHVGLAYYICLRHVLGLASAMPLGTILHENSLFAVML